MPNALTYQKKLKNKLRRYFDEVDIERSVVKGAEDFLQRDPLRYAPRLDLVIGPYNIRRGNHWKSNIDIKEGLFLYRNRNTRRFFDVVSRMGINKNPRYAVAIEVVFSGSDKHILGDITNASTLGLYGFVIAKPDKLLKAQRILRHLQDLKKLEKVDQSMFNNVKIVSTREFDSYFQNEQR